MTDKIAQESHAVISRLNACYEALKNHGRKQRGPIRFLQLSDLHFTESTNDEYELLNLQRNLEAHGHPIERGHGEPIDFIVLCGDLSNGSRPEEYKKVRRFLTGLGKFLDIPAQRMIIVPGNHDYSRAITHKAFEISDDGEFNKKEDYRIDDGLYLKRNDSAWKNRFDYFNRYLYQYVYNKSFPLDKQNQTQIHYDRTHNIAFVMLNTAADIDHFFPRRAFFDHLKLASLTNILTNSLQKELSESEFRETVWIAVGHHPLDFSDDTNCIANLQDLGFSAYLHGHVHRDVSIQYGNPQYKNDRMMVVGANTFSVAPSHRRPGMPLR
ncbi:MAG: metallophosphoesterase, partial [bacterium]|nr:metallophosphoesterase [bacterium]